MVDIIEIEDESEKALVCRQVLDLLPRWFGLPESNEEYCRESRRYRMLAAYDGTGVVGFISTRENTRDTAEIYVTGVLESYHRKGIGRIFIDRIEEYYKSRGFRMLEVKTLHESRPSEEYDRTRAFYKGMGFLELENLPELWGPQNPCLIMVKSLIELMR